MASPVALSDHSFQKPFVVNISFRSNLSRPQLWDAIGKHRNPYVILWYIGPNGFRTAGMKYYQEDLRKLQKMENDPQCFLYDMSAWAALRKKEINIETMNPNVVRINEFGIERIRAFASSEFFRWLQTLEDAPLNYLQQVVLGRKWIFTLSTNMQDYGIKVGEIFANQCPVLEPIYPRDCATTYSALQYIEGLYLIDKIAEKAISDGKEEISVLLALPNNEWEYYADPDGSFREDVSALLEFKKLKIRINIEFCCFKFGKQISHRPYNALGHNMGDMGPADLLGP